MIPNGLVEEGSRGRKVRRAENDEGIEKQNKQKSAVTRENASNLHLQIHLYIF